MKDEFRKNYYSSGYYHGMQPEPRFERVTRIFTQLRGARLLDVGCGDGEITLSLMKAMSAETASGVELSEQAVAKAKSNGIDAVRCDLDSEDLPYADDYFDAAYLGEIIEHVFNPERLLGETYRVLKLNGICVLTTPNLAGWPSRLALLLGYQPFPVAASPEHENAGKIFVQDSQGQWGHIRVMTLGALKQLVSVSGFEIVRVYGCPVTIKGSSRFNKIIAGIDTMFAHFPRFSTRVILVLAKRHNSAIAEYVGASSGNSLVEPPGRE